MANLSSMAQSVAPSSSQNDIQSAYLAWRSLSDQHLAMVRETIEGTSSHTFTDFLPPLRELALARQRFDAAMAPHIGWRSVALSS